VSGHNEIKKGSDATEPVANALEVESSTGETKPEMTGKFKKYDIFAARVIKFTFPATAAIAAFYLAGGIVGGSIYFLIGPLEIAQISVFVVGTPAAYYVFRYSWGLHESP